MCERIDFGNGTYGFVCGVRKARPKVKFPATKDELKAAGWSLRASRSCRLCKTPLEFWKTLNGKMMPLEPTIIDSRFVYVSHWATCPHAAEFTKKKPAAPARPPEKGLFDDSPKTIP